MERASRPSHRSSSMASPMLGLVHSPPVSATSPHRGRFPENVGLGISGCAVEPSYGPMANYSNQTNFPVNPVMPNNLMSVENIYNLPLEADDFCGRSCYEIYNGHPDPTQFSVNFYGAQPMSMTHSYDPALEVGAGQGAFPGQIHEMPGPWAHTPMSAPPTPIQSMPAAADRTMENQWNHGIYIGPNNSFQSPAMSHSRTFNPPIPQPSQSSASGTIGEDHIKSTPTASGSQGLSAGESTVEPSRASKRGRKPSAEKGCKCPVCGFYFTRRSNCIAHQKKHDPTFHRAIPCEECSKSFGRNADLRRHVDTVHRGIRKHVCKWCSRRYTRWENMVRHFAECEEKPENERTPSPPRRLSHDADCYSVSPSRPQS